MIDPFKTAKFLDNLQIKAEEYWLMYRIMVNQNNYKDNTLKIPDNDNIIEFSRLSELYQTRFKNDINWVDMCYKLEEKGYLQIWSKEKNLTYFKLSELKVTEKFLQYFYITDVESAFEEFINIYPKQLRLKDAFSKTPKIISVWGKNSRDDLINLFKVIILKGNNNILFARFMELTKLYLADNDSQYATYNIEGYFKAFEGIAYTYESKLQENMNTPKLFNDDI